MLRRNLLIGGLVAGVFVLPTLASAKVAGICSNCHTMHSSQNGSNGVATALVGTGCASCHANGTSINNTTNGKSNAATGAPQVTINAGGAINAAGYFVADGDVSSAKQHNVVMTGMSADANILVNVPGSTTGVYQVTCQGCHVTAGHHTATNYRMLGSNAATAGGTGDYNPNAAGVFPGKRSDLTYNAAGMNNVCAACHGAFHGTGDQFSGGAWIRHPTDVSMATVKAEGAGAPSLQGTFTATDRVVVGTTTAVGTDVVMCLSCHVAHGGPNNDLLSFTYSTNSAGDGSVPVNGGCETCHSYGSAGM